jgi:hypothetical protein
MSQNTTACPISFEPKIDAILLRINAIFYIIFVWSAVLLEQPYIILLLVAIFISKNININKKCALDYFSHFLAKSFKLKEKKIDPAPKKLANAMGLVGSTVIFLVLYFEVSFALVPISIMSIAFFLEAIFDYCIGCKIYTLYHKIL